MEVARAGTASPPRSQFLRRAQPQRASTDARACVKVGARERSVFARFISNPLPSEHGLSKKDFPAKMSEKEKEKVRDPSGKGTNNAKKPPSAAASTSDTPSAFPTTTPEQPASDDCCHHCPDTATVSDHPGKGTNKKPEVTAAGSMSDTPTSESPSAFPTATLELRATSEDTKPLASSQNPAVMADSRDCCRHCSDDTPVPISGTAESAELERVGTGNPASWLSPAISAADLLSENLDEYFDEDFYVSDRPPLDPRIDPRWFPENEGSTSEEDARDAQPKSSSSSSSISSEDIAVVVAKGNVERFWEDKDAKEKAELEADREAQEVLAKLKTQLTGKMQDIYDTGICKPPPGANEAERKAHIAKMLESLLEGV